MKLNTLLLTSAATLMATTVAFAADLPSKKAAASSGAVQVCKVGGMTGFTLPGSDTCLQISGRVTIDLGNDSDDDNTFGYGTPFGNNGSIGYRLNFDARSNTEVGVVRSYLSFTNEDGTAGSSNETGARKAFIQIGGFTVGLKDSLADISGTVGNFYGSGMSQSAYGVDYKVAIGNGMTLAIGAEMSQGDAYDNTPDVLVGVSGAAGTLNYNVVGVFGQDDYGDSVYGVIGHVDTKLAAGVSVYGFAGYGDAIGYIADINYQYAGYENSVYGGGITFDASKQLSVTAEGRVSYNAYYDYNETSFAVSASYALAKNLSITPEVVVYKDDNSDAYTETWVRIKRDF